MSYFIGTIGTRHASKTNSFVEECYVMELEDLWSPFEIEEFNETILGHRYAKKKKNLEKKNTEGKPLVEDIEGLKMFTFPKWEGKTKIKFKNILYKLEDSKELLEQKELTPFTKEDEEKIVQLILNKIGNKLNNLYYTIQYTCPIKEEVQTTDEKGVVTKTTKESTVIERLNLPLTSLPSEHPSIQKKRSYAGEEYTVVIGSKSEWDIWRETYVTPLLNVWHQQETKKEGVPFSLEGYLSALRLISHSLSILEE